MLKLDGIAIRLQLQVLDRRPIFPSEVIQVNTYMIKSDKLFEAFLDIVSTSVEATN